MTSGPDHCDPGYRIVTSVLDDAETSELLHSLQTSQVTRSRAGARHLMAHPGVNAVATDPRLLEIAGECLGRSPVPFRATLFDKSPAANWLVTWHQDTTLPIQERRDAPGWGPWAVKSGITYAQAPAAALARVVALRLHFDDSRADNGPLRVLPGTHTLGVLTDAEIDRAVAGASAVECLAPAGGIVAMRPLILHASSKSASDRPRRVLHIEYADSLQMPDGLALAIA